MILKYLLGVGSRCKPIIAEKDRSKTATVFGGGLEDTSTPPTESPSPASHSPLQPLCGAPGADLQPANHPGNHPLHFPSVGKQQISACLLFPAASPGSRVSPHGEETPHPNASRRQNYPTYLFQTGEYKILHRNSSSQTDLKYLTIGTEQLL